MLRQITILLMSLTLCWTTLACSSPNSTQYYRNPSNNTSSPPTQLSAGQYPVQQATYNDINGEYSLMLLNTPPGTSPAFRTTDLQMARLSDSEIAAGQKGYLEVKGGQAVLHLPEDFKIEYVHNETQTQTNPQTGQPETVVVRQHSSFWTPFAGALAGQAIGSLLFTPRYYVPPVYQPGVVMRGYGGYGSSYGQAVERYQSRYQAPPPAVKNRQTFRTTGPAVKNRQTFRTTGRLKSPSYNQPTFRRTPTYGNRSTGSGYGSSKLRRSNKSYPTRTKRPSSFGSGRAMRRPSSFGTRRR